MRAETDIELCRVTEVKSKEKVMYALMKSGVPYAEEWEKVPLVKRRKFHGAKEVCVVITHKAKMDLAKCVIENLDEDVKADIVWDL